jgi:hypothetical protein
MVNLGEAAIRAPFLLAAEEEADIMAVASTSVALSGLTITPSLPPDAVSGDWTYGGLGGGRLSPFAASARASHSCGGSISLALTEAPSLASFSPLMGGGFGGGLVEVVEVLVHRGGLQLINMHSVSHIASR